MAYFILIFFALALSAAFLFLGGYRISDGRIITVTPFYFSVFRAAKRTYLDRNIPGLSIEQEEEELRRWFRVLAATPPALLAAQFAVLAF